MHKDRLNEGYNLEIQFENTCIFKFGMLYTNTGWKHQCARKKCAFGCSRYIFNT